MYMIGPWRKRKQEPTQEELYLRGGIIQPFLRIFQDSKIVRKPVRWETVDGRTRRKSLLVQWALLPKSSRTESLSTDKRLQYAESLCALYSKFDRPGFLMTLRSDLLITPEGSLLLDPVPSLSLYDMGGQNTSTMTLPHQTFWYQLMHIGQIDCLGDVHLFGLGIQLYEILEGHKPYDFENKEVARQATRWLHTALRTQGRGEDFLPLPEPAVISEDVFQVLRKMLVISPETNFESDEQAIEEIQAALQAESG